MQNHEIRYFNEQEAEQEGLDGEGWYWWCEDEWMGPFSCEMAAEDNSDDYFD